MRERESERERERECLSCMSLSSFKRDATIKFCKKREKGMQSTTAFDTCMVRTKARERERGCVNHPFKSFLKKISFKRNRSNDNFVSVLCYNNLERLTKTSTKTAADRLSRVCASAQSSLSLSLSYSLTIPVESYHRLQAEVMLLLFLAS